MPKRMSFEEAAEFQIPFGKFRNMTLAELHQEEGAEGIRYLLWMSKLDNLYDDTAEALDVFLSDESLEDDVMEAKELEAGYADRGGGRGRSSGGARRPSGGYGGGRGRSSGGGYGGDRYRDEEPPRRARLGSNRDDEQEDDRPARRRDDDDRDERPARRPAPSQGRRPWQR